MRWEWNIKERGASRVTPGVSTRAAGRMELSLTETVMTTEFRSECWEMLSIYPSKRNCQGIEYAHLDFREVWAGRKCLDPVSGQRSCLKLRD